MVRKDACLPAPNLNIHGFYHHRGRTGDMLRVSGIWISPAEIEDVLAGIRSISETAAVLGESEIGLAEIVLYIVPAPGADGSAAVAAAAVRNCPRSATHGDRQGPAQQASRATAARPALTPAGGRPAASPRSITPHC